MASLKDLHERSGSTCELCTGTENLQIFEVQPSTLSDNEILLCKVCMDEINGAEKLDANHWRTLNNTMWSEVKAIQIMAWRILTRLKAEGEDWAQDLLDMLYLDEETLGLARATGIDEKDSFDDAVIHKDSNGTVLQAGDTVVLIKDLDVKGGGFTAKRGTAVRGITLVENNPSQIEGRVNGQQIVILTQFVKKSG